MASLLVDGDRVVVSLTTLQSVMGLAREVSVPVSSITGVHVVADGLADLDLGLRVGGAGVPRRLAVGRYRKFRGARNRTFAALYAGQPALVIETSGGDWDRLAIALDEPEADAQRVRAAAGLA